MVIIITISSDYRNQTSRIRMNLRLRTIACNIWFKYGSIMLKRRDDYIGDLYSDFIQTPFKTPKSIDNEKLDRNGSSSCEVTDTWI